MDKWISLVKARMRELNVTQEQLAERIGVSQGAVGHWLNKRREPKLEVMNQILAALDLAHLRISPMVQIAEPDGSYCVAGDSTTIPSALIPQHELYFRYPVISWEAAGQLAEPGPFTYPDGRFETTDYQARGAAFWLEVQGDAMTAPLGLSVPEGMLILVDPAIEAVVGKLVIAKCHGRPGATFRQLSEEGGQRYLRPLNPTYPKVLLTEQCCLLGVVVQATVKF
ncbi:helix-turn-helix domain-containing protein [Pseudomonas sp. LS1212]|uniref:LexA family protein n=1 Tax=Pseudomonas sp. LS1212 TaxID=2972478 RepID=UPI00215BF2E0|nr:S24 family peptidase [Pseudomonas sp. LS1212]UVJ42346.1 helix-turn-helix domain-containing protein [Pseudomonas sp. LS1212]